jgi:hypothetical protein
VLETDRRGVPARLFYHVNLPRLAALLSQHGQADSVADHTAQLDHDHILQLDPEHHPQQVAGDGLPQATGYGLHHREIIEENIQESKEKMSISPPQGTNTPPRNPVANPRRSTPCPKTSW